MVEVVRVSKEGFLLEIKEVSDSDVDSPVQLKTNLVKQ